MTEELKNHNKKEDDNNQLGNLIQCFYHDPAGDQPQDYRYHGEDKEGTPMPLGTEDSRKKDRNKGVSIERGMEFNRKDRDYKNDKAHQKQ